MIISPSKHIDTNDSPSERRESTSLAARKTGDGLLEMRKQALYRRASSFENTCGNHPTTFRRSLSSSPKQRRCRRNSLAKKRRSKSAPSSSKKENEPPSVTATIGNSRWESQPLNQDKSDKAPVQNSGDRPITPALLSSACRSLGSEEVVCNSASSRRSSDDDITADDDIPPPLQHIKVVVLSRWDSSDTLVDQAKKRPQAKPERIVSPKATATRRRRTTGSMPQLPFRKPSFKKVGARAG